MTTSTRDQLLQFRATADLATSASEQAQRQGISLSEFFRRAVERELSVAEAQPATAQTLSVDDMVNLSARGDHDAQAALSEHYRQGHAGITRDLSSGLATVYGQMAAQSGNVRHVLQWASALIHRIDFICEGDWRVHADAVTYLTSHALAALEVCADAGHVPSQYLAVEIAARALPEHIPAARALKPTIRVNPLAPDEIDADVDLGPLVQAFANFERTA